MSTEAIIITVHDIEVISYVAEGSYNQDLATLLWVLYYYGNSIRVLNIVVILLHNIVLRTNDLGHSPIT